MNRSRVLLVLALGCGGDGAYPPEDCTPPLPATDQGGNVWPTYAEANATLAECPDEGADLRRRGTCSDGKAFLERSGSFVGETYYFAGETLVGLLRYTDDVLSCEDYRFGDTECEELDAEVLSCP